VGESQEKYRLGANRQDTWMRRTPRGRKENPIAVSSRWGCGRWVPSQRRSPLEQGRPRSRGPPTGHVSIPVPGRSPPCPVGCASV
jgi:hypothetical protein